MFLCPPTTPCLTHHAHPTPPTHTHTPPARPPAVCDRLVRRESGVLSAMYAKPSASLSARFGWLQRLARPRIARGGTPRIQRIGRQSPATGKRSRRAAQSPTARLRTDQNSIQAWPLPAQRCRGKAAWHQASRSPRPPGTQCHWPGESAGLATRRTCKASPPPRPSGNRSCLGLGSQHGWEGATVRGPPSSTKGHPRQASASQASALRRVPCNARLPGQITPPRPPLRDAPPPPLLNHPTPP